MSFLVVLIHLLAGWLAALAGWLRCAGWLRWLAGCAGWLRWLAGCAGWLAALAVLAGWLAGCAGKKKFKLFSWNLFQHFREVLK